MDDGNNTVQFGDDSHYFMHSDYVHIDKGNFRTVTLL